MGERAGPRWTIVAGAPHGTDSRACHDGSVPKRVGGQRSSDGLWWGWSAGEGGTGSSSQGRPCGKRPSDRSCLSVRTCRSLSWARGVWCAHDGSVTPCELGFSSSQRPPSEASPHGSCPCAVAPMSGRRIAIKGAPSTCGGCTSRSGQIRNDAKAEASRDSRGCAMEVPLGLTILTLPCSGSLAIGSPSIEELCPSTYCRAARDVS